MGFVFENTKRLYPVRQGVLRRLPPQVRLRRRVEARVVVGERLEFDEDDGASGST